MNARRFALTAWATAAAAALIVGGSYAAGLRFNTTVSAPRGLWRISRIEPASVRPGEMVSVCPPAEGVVIYMRKQGFIGPGDCPGTGSEPFLKPVVAVAGDTVTVLPGGPVEVNGTPLPNSKPLAHMPAWPAGTYKVQPGQVWLISSYDPGSFDSRYFGPVPAANIRGQAVPVLIRGDAAAVTPHPLLHVADAGEGK
ncbi:MAG: conjugative transfer signal peptidase TraF [Acidiphilium sp.]|nr:conjugative transfer signal peptidase TraF [Acidiphilium sp.]MDD4937220.1 conjugative transfer signal peptidase TraF [Acidiphilium sp.]